MAPTSDPKVTQMNQNSVCPVASQMPQGSSQAGHKCNLRSPFLMDTVSSLVWYILLCGACSSDAKGLEYHNMQMELSVNHFL